MSKPIIYQMLPRLWGEGRISSVDDATLDYLRGLGVSHVWCTGILRHSTGKPFVKGDAGSPYAISDYYDVNPYLADVPSRRMSEFHTLVRRVHSHGLKLIIDFVPNHVGCDYSDRHGGIPLCGWHDYDWSDTVKIDYSAPGTWEAMYGIVRFWASKGVDGFRCDMVELVPPEFLKWLIARIKEEFPSVIFIAEVYQKEKYRMYIEDVRFDYLYDKSGLYDVLRAIVAGHGTARAITWNWQFLQDFQPRMLNFLENHDEQRLASPWFAGRPDLYAALC
ncbi:MAG: alpha-amylase, partial [Bacteroidales bacterium]|nr:alpha-amylase [Bacteroidales bacterium]